MIFRNLRNLFGILKILQIFIVVFMQCHFTIICEMVRRMVRTFAAFRGQSVMVDVTVVTPEAKDAFRAPAFTGYRIADLVEGTHVAVTFSATCSHVPVTFDARGAVTTLEQRLAGTLTALLVAFDGTGAQRIAVTSCKREIFVFRFLVKSRESEYETTIRRVQF